MASTVGTVIGEVQGKEEKLAQMERFVLTQTQLPASINASAHKSFVSGGWEAQGAPSRESMGCR